MSSIIIMTRVQPGILQNQCLISGRGRDFSHLHSIQTNSGATQASYAIGNWGLFSGSKICGGVMLTSHLYIVTQVKKDWSYTSTSGHVSKWVVMSVITFYMLSFYKCTCLQYSYTL